LRTGKGIEWECAVSFVARLYSWKMGGNGKWRRLQNFMKPLNRWKADNPNPMHQCWRKENINQMVETLSFSSVKWEKKNIVWAWFMSLCCFLKMRNRSLTKKEVKNSMQPSVVTILEKNVLFLDSASLKAVPSFFILKGQNQIWIFMNSTFCGPLCSNALMKQKMFL